MVPNLSNKMSSCSNATESETSLKIPVTTPSNGSRLPYRSTCLRPPIAAAIRIVHVVQM